MVDFSKTPEGATHYDDSTSTLAWWKVTDSVWFYLVDGSDCWYGVFGTPSGVKGISQPEQIHNPLTVLCDNERQKMLCEQVIRMCRGEASQYQHNDEWITIDENSKNPLLVCVEYDYRAKPKKELVVPWEWLDDCIHEVMVDENLKVWQRKKVDKVFSARIYGLKLDLTDIELPVTVKRPEGK